MQSVERSEKEFYAEIRESQENWRKGRQGILSKSWELPWLSSRMDRGFKSTFAGFIDPEFPPVLVAGSVLLAQNNAHKEVVKQVNIPSFAVDRVNDFVSGISILDEWATDYATDYYLKQGKGKLSKAIRYFHSGSLFTPTGRLMRDIGSQAKASEQDFDHAVLSAVFLHDNKAIDNIIQRADFNGLSGLSELALFTTEYSKEEIEKRRQDILPLTAPPTKETPIQNLIRRLKVSGTIGGIVNEPGVAEIILDNWLTAGIFLFSLCGAIAPFALNPIMSLVFNAASLGLTSLKAPTVIHECVHVYAQSNEFRGLRPFFM